MLYAWRLVKKRVRTETILWANVDNNKGIYYARVKRASTLFAHNYYSGPFESLYDSPPRSSRRWYLPTFREIGSHADI